MVWGLRDPPPDGLARLSRVSRRKTAVAVVIATTMIVIAKRSFAASDVVVPSAEVNQPILASRPRLNTRS